MQAVVIQSFGDSSGLVVSEQVAPTPAPDQVVIAVEAAGVGGVDTLIRSGALASYGFVEGHIPGTEVAGEIIATGSGVDPSWNGQRVWAPTGTGGGYAEQVSVSEESLVPLPKGLSAAEAVTLGGSGLVGHFALRRANLGAGESVLIRGAAGGIGVMAIQLAARQGAGMIAVTTSSRGRGERLRALGANQILDRDAEPLDPVAATASYDVIIDVIAGPALPAFISKLSANGRMIVVGLIAGPPPSDFGMTIFGAFQRSTTFGTFSTDCVAAPERRHAVAELFTAAVQGELRAIIHDQLPLRNAALAHHAMDTGDVLGRIVLMPEPSKHQRPQDYRRFGRD